MLCTSAARKGKKVIVVESGQPRQRRGGKRLLTTGNQPVPIPVPLSRGEGDRQLLSVEEQDYYSNGTAHYIECREGYDRLWIWNSSAERQYGYGRRIRERAGLGMRKTRPHAFALG